MSLKGFHLFFVTVSVLMSIFVFGWAVSEMMKGAGAGGGMLLLAAVCLVAAVLLAFYGVRVRRKLRYLGEPRPELKVLK